jgi:hypothetical protein
MIDVADRSHVHVGFRSLKFLLCHSLLKAPPKINARNQTILAERPGTL